jgi:hypothetical protein
MQPILLKLHVQSSTTGGFNTSSELTNCTGSIIKPIFMNKKEVKGYLKTSKLQWPVQQIPALDTMHVWVKHITPLSNCGKNEKIVPRLGNWITDPSEKIWIQYWIHNSESFVINQPTIDNKWFLHQKCADKYGKISFCKIGKEYTTTINFSKFFWLIYLNHQVKLLSIHVE